MDVKRKMEPMMLNDGNNLDEKDNSIVVNVFHNLQLKDIETIDNTSTMKAKIDHASRMIRMQNSARAEIDTMLTERKWDLESLMPKLKYMRYFNPYGYENPTSKIHRMQEALVNYGRSHSITSKGANIKRLSHQMNRCNNSKEERKILKEIQLVEENSISEDVLKNIMSWKWSSWGLVTSTNPKEILRQRIGEAFKELQSSSALARERIAKEKNVKKEVEKAKNDIRSYRAALDKINKNKAELYEYILRLEKQLDKNCHIEAIENYQVSSLTTLYKQVDFLAGQISGCNSDDKW